MQRKTWYYEKWVGRQAAFSPSRYVKRRILIYSFYLDENNLEVYESMVYYEAYKHVIQAMTTMKKLPFGETLFKTCDNPTGQ